MSALRVFAASSLCGLILCCPRCPSKPPPAAGPARRAAANHHPARRAAIRPEPRSVPGIRHRSHRPVTVTDDKGRFVSNLVKKDFRVLDEGKPQNIEFFSLSRNSPSWSAS